MCMFKSKKKSYFRPCILNKGATFRAVSILDPVSYLKDRHVYFKSKKKIFLFLSVRLK
jgi:hypothetical protein